ncbi:protein GAMETE CELL DEFECTIVE 1, mitochondrial-like [Vigna umbellata]|uniref:protein GAMETE CELL DEFECTIVE 1, mitochondrial-like n=1 Tax=Vigna umbellata TaxID=87088 RepID=UPI001F5FA6A6|nr:protein GAMETE CELL DEFECTIVE 1, mitochondrial-like [Vigna umbellata]
MQGFRRITTATISTAKQFKSLTSIIPADTHFSPSGKVPVTRRWLSSRKSRSGEDEWNEAWETAWLPEDLTPKTRAPWESDVNFPSSSSSAAVAVDAVPEADEETKAFVAEMNENWNERRRGRGSKEKEKREENGALYSVENMKKDYRLKKQRLHAGLWLKEIEKLEEAKLADSDIAAGDDIQRLIDSCSDIFYPGNNDLNNAQVQTAEFKNMPDGWETISKNQEGNVWEMSQREEDILLQEFERRIAYSKFQIASFIKTHIFSRRRPIDGWKYMIEVVGPNAKRGKGSVSRVPSLSDPSTKPFKEEKNSVDKTYLPLQRR